MPGSIWGQNFSYDAFGNITKTVIPGSAGNSFQPTYSSSTNRITAISGFTPTYDHNGNVLNDNSHIYTMDADNKAVTIDGIGVTYDALDRMVEQNRSGAHTQIVYAATGEKFALMSGQTLHKAFVPLPGGGTAVYNNSGLLYFGHSDHLGSMRVGSTPTRTVSFDLAYAPFGETYAPFGSTDTSFTGQRADTSLGLFDFPVREYSNQGRWSTPDLAGLAAASLGFPQSWNRYAYVGNNPLAFIDPLGFGPCDSPYEGLCGGNCADGDIVCSPCDSSFVACVTATTLPPPTPGQCDYVQCGNSGGGSSNGGGGKVGGAPGAGKRESFADCVKHDGDYFSIQNGLSSITGGRLGNRFLASTFLGNPFSSLIQAGQNLMSSFLGSAAASNTSQAVGSFAATPIANRIPNLAFAAAVAGSASLQTSGFSAATSVVGRISGTLPLGSLARVGAGALDSLGRLWSYR